MNTVNFSDIVTLFFITVGNANKEDALRALQEQSLLCKIDTIENVAPMSAAFQQMIDRCQTVYFIQVDEDMVLQKDAAELMLEDMKNQPKNVIQLTYLLHDIHLESDIQGVKIYRTELMKEFNYCDVQGCEVDLLKQASKKGYKAVSRNEVVGLHSPKWSRRGIYERYSTIYQRYGLEAHGWHSRFRFIAEKYARDPTDNHLYALLGAAEGVISAGEEKGEKDFRKYKRDVNFERFERILNVDYELKISLADQMEQLFQRFDRVILFGAGQHTHWLLDLIVSDDRNLLIIDGKADLWDSQIAGITVREPQSLNYTSTDCIVLSTDVHQQEMKTAIKSHNIEVSEVIDLYENHTNLDLIRPKIISKLNKLTS